MVYEVVVLIEDRHTDYDILRNLGTIDIEDRRLCLTKYERAHYEAYKYTLFKYDVYGLFDQHIEPYICNGVIAICNYCTLNRYSDRILRRLDQIASFPFLLIVQNCPTEHRADHLYGREYHTVYIPEKVYPRIEGCYEAINMWLVNSMDEKHRKPHIYRALPNYNTTDILSNNVLSHLFETQTLKRQAWDHYTRIRLIFISLRYYGYEDTINVKGWLCSHWCKYHIDTCNYSLIRLWVEQILLCIKSFSEETCIFSTLYYNNPHLSDAKLHTAYYTSDVLNSKKAKDNYVPPNIIPEPQCTIM